jgi:predicted homoserine dehydrogenase-like protein
MFEQLKALTEPIKIVVVGAGAMGMGLCYQSRVTPGIQCVGIADIVLERAIKAAELLQTPYRIIHSEKEAQQAIHDGVLAICEDGGILARSEGYQAFLEATNSIIAGGRMALDALCTGKHLILMNAEIDLAFGPYLMQVARENGVVMASCDGDQHGVIKRVVDEMTLWGFEPVMAGNIKGFLDLYSNPTKIIPEADKRRLDYRMATAYTDGTKLNIEMALVANALGMRTDKIGMHGPRAGTVHEVLSLYDFPTLHRAGAPVVDYILGAEPGGGVFAVGYCDHPYQVPMLQYYKMGDGPYYLFYRPYHLCHIEAMRGVAEAVLAGISLLEPRYGFRTNVFAYAKKDLKFGETLDGIGGYACYGLIENGDPATAPDGIPICLTEHVTLKRDIRKDERIPMDAVAFDANRFDFATYALALEASATISRGKRRE